MRAVVLVGGFGTRLRPLTLGTPKQMLPIVGLPMIERVLGHLRTHGVEEAVLSLGYRPDAFTDAYPDATCAGVHLSYAVEPAPLDTAGAIRFAASAAGIQEPFLVVNGDVLTALDVTALVAEHTAAGAEGSIALTLVDDPSHFGVVPTDENGRVLAFVEKPPLESAPTNAINAGFYVLEPSVLDRIPADRPVNVERETFPAMVADGTLHARVHDAYWIDVGTPERYLQASLDLLSDPIGYLGQGACVEAGAVVSRSVLEAGAVVEGGARVVHSVLLAGARVAGGATVHRSILGRGAVVGADASVEALSVLGDDVSVAPGASLYGERIPDAEVNGADPRSILLG